MKNEIFSMKGKNVIFTGGGGNLGRVMVKSLLDYGACVAVPEVVDSFDETFDEYRNSGKLLVIMTDLSDSADIKRCFAEINDKFGSINVLVNCAAYGGGAGGRAAEFRVEKLDDETWETGIDGTLSVSFRCTREVIPYLQASGGGSIVNVSSMYALKAPDFSVYGDDIPWTPPFYGAGKAGLIQFTRYCASAYAKYNIRVNSITPGPFPNITPKTDMAFIDRLSDRTMMKRTGKAEELNGAMLLLCSDASSFMTGTNIVVDGGMTEGV